MISPCENKNAELAGQRHMTYVFLSAMYAKEVSYDLLERMRIEKPFVGESLNSFYNELEHTAIEAMRTDLAADYAQLFLGMSAHPVAPFESVYTSEEGLLMQGARDKVLALLRQEGLAIPKDFGLPEDHLALEFDFMAFLCKKEQEAIECNDIEMGRQARQKQKQFLRDHLANWVPRMCDDVSDRARTGFYRGLAQLTKEFIEEELYYFEN